MELPRRSSVITKLTCSVIFLVIVQIPESDAHGRLIEPPSRASAWRYGFNTPPNYNDHELFCGGFTKQYQGNGKDLQHFLSQK